MALPCSPRNFPWAPRASVSITHTRQLKQLPSPSTSRFPTTIQAAFQATSLCAFRLKPAARPSNPSSTRPIRLCFNCKARPMLLIASSAQMIAFNGFCSAARPPTLRAPSSSRTTHLRPVAASTAPSGPKLLAWGGRASQRVSSAQTEQHPKARGNARPRVLCCSLLLHSKPRRDREKHEAVSSENPDDCPKCCEFLHLRQPA